jgi:hypothetical protein
LDSSEVPLAADMHLVFERASATAAEDEFREVSLTRLLSAVLELEASGRLEGDVSMFLDSDAVRSSDPGRMTVADVSEQREQVMQAAARQAASSGSEEVRVSDFLVACCMALGDQVPLLDGCRLAVSRVARAQVSGGGLLATGELTKQALVSAATTTSTEWVAAGPTRRFGGNLFAFLRGWARSNRTTLEIILFLPGVLVREALWVVLAWFARTNRLARSFLGVAEPSALARPAAIKTRLRLELWLHGLCLALGLFALAAWIIPQRVLGLLGSAELNLGSEQQLIVTSILSGGGVLSLGPWVPWALLAVSVPTWELLQRIRWTTRFYGGPFSRGAAYVLLAVATPTRPLDVVLSRIGLPGIMARGFVVILISTLAMRAAARWIGG